MRQADLEQLYVRLEKPMYNVAFRWTWNIDEARDLVQEAFVRLWNMGARVEPDSAEALVYRILMNLIASRGRKRRVWRWVTLQGARQAETRGPSAEERLVRQAELDQVRQAIDALPESLRRVVVLCECSDLSYAEIGRILSIPEGTVGSRRHRALGLLRERLTRGGSADDRPATGSV